MPLDPQARFLLDQIAARGGFYPARMSPADARRAVVEMRLPSVPEPVASVEERSVPGPAGPIPVRVYTPAGAARPAPVIVYFHGGGWVLGDLDSGDNLCRMLANRVQAVVVNVAYRLAPENHYPAAAEDCYTATRWVAVHGAEIGVHGTRIAVVGDSAGGNLAAVVALMARDRGVPSLRHQVLIYPVTDCDLDAPAYRQNADGLLLTREDLQWYWSHYVPEPVQRRDAYASPMRANNLAGVAPATVITAELDLLRDEGEAYAARLKEAGVPVTCTRHDGQIHGFVGFFKIFDQGRIALERIASVLQDALGS
jgi:acetyl esterase